MTVAELLVASQAAHERARQVTKGTGGNRVVVRPRDLVALRGAYDKRSKAHRADPKHSDPAWQVEQARTPTGRDTHAEMMAFYREQLGL